MKKKRANPQASDESIELKNRLEEAKETLRAIQQNRVDALLVRRSNGTQVVTLHDADFPYRMMVESMNEGAVTLIADGTIFYCNPRFSEMVQIESENLIGTPFRNLIDETIGLDQYCLKNARHQSEGGTLTTSKDIIPGFH